MSQIPEQVTAGSASEPLSLDPLDLVTSPHAVERRVWRNTLVVAAIAFAAAAVLAELRFTLGVALGGMLALLNYRWLQSSLRAALSTGSHKMPPGTTIKFLFRWLIVLSAVFIAARTGYVNPMGLIAGLFAPAAAILIEAGYVGLKTIAQLQGEK